MSERRIHFARANQLGVQGVTGLLTRTPCYEVTVIGSGMAGVMAALAARAAGARVSLVAGQPGATALASGAWDIAVSPRVPLQQDWGEGGGGPRRVLGELIRDDPRHPYAICSRALGSGDVTKEFAKALATLTAKLSYRPVGSLEAELPLITPLGSIKWTTLADPTQGAVNLTQVRGGRLLAIGIPGLAPFPITLLQKVLAVSLPAGIFTSIVAEWIEVEGIPQHSLSPFALAELFEAEPTFSKLVAALHRAVKDHRPTHLLLPPVIGVERAPRLLHRLSQELRVACFESLATVPSVPGLRRHRALVQLLAAQELTRIAGRVVGFRGGGGMIRQLVVEHENNRTEFPVERIVLASGRFLAGGMERKGEMKEAIFGLPVFARGEVVGSRFVGTLVERDYLAAHDLFSSGVAVDDRLRPRNRWGEVMFENLFAAGSLLGGYSAAASGTGTGVAILTGWLAGRKAAE